MADFHPLRSLRDDSSTDPEWVALNQLAAQLAASQPTAPVPSLAHLSYRDYDHVYEPSHDTYLLLDALQYELQQLQPHFRDRTAPIICLEIGCGSGVASVLVRTQWRRLFARGDNAAGDDAPPPPLLSYVTDVNPRALQVTRETFRQAALVENDDNGSPNSNDTTDFVVEAVQCDLASALLPRLQHAVTWLLFNPPYVPTPDDEVGSMGIEAAWAGGVDGRRVIDRFLPQMAQLLERPPRGGGPPTANLAAAAYLVTVDENRPAELAARLKEEWGLRMRPLFRRRTKNEFLTVQKITWMEEESCGDDGSTGDGGGAGKSGGTTTTSGTESASQML